MKKLLITLLLVISSSSLLADSTTSFMRRFGPNSHIYNVPVYFNCSHLLSSVHSRVETNNTHNRKVSTKKSNVKVAQAKKQKAINWESEAKNLRRQLAQAQRKSNA